ncbi:hypothetical protein [Stenotrophomonas sp.]|uniref:hypothetical protein n=1 Tax=Stenotrophomonas sp. TaxID=69392 RepID=UPI0028AABB60|nr:hypothetical protein [Stenotrophomonas sp.]
MQSHRADAPSDVSAAHALPSVQHPNPNAASPSQAVQDEAEWPGAIPVVMLRGKWLHRLGFPPRCLVRIEARKGVITLTPAGPRAKFNSAIPDHFGDRPRYTQLKDPQITQATLDSALRCHFREAAWRVGKSPSLLLRLLMQRYVDVDQDRFALNLPLWGHSERKAATLVARELVAQQVATESR